TKYSLNSSDENLLSLSYSCSNGSRSLPYNPFTTNSLAPVFTSLYLWIVICKSWSVSVTIYSTLTKKNTPLCSISFSTVLITSAIKNSSLYYTLCTSIATMCSLLTYKKPYSVVDSIYPFSNIIVSYILFFDSSLSAFHSSLLPSAVIIFIIYLLIFNSSLLIIY